MTEIDPWTYKRIENAVLTFVRDHPNLSREEILKRISGFSPSSIKVALFLLKKNGLLEFHLERHADGKWYEHWHPARLDRP